MFPQNREQGLWVFLNLTKGLMQRFAVKGGKRKERDAWIATYDRMYAEAQREAAQHPWPPLNDMNAYQRWAAARAADAPVTKQLTGLGLGAAGEAGEIAGEMLEAFVLLAGINKHAGAVADIAKKVDLHGKLFTPEIKERLIKELGDELWYVSVFARKVLNVDLSTIADANVIKLEARSKDAKYAAENPNVAAKTLKVQS